MPRVFEKIEEGMKAKAATGGLKKKVGCIAGEWRFCTEPEHVIFQLGDWAKAQALAHHKAEEGGQPHTSLGYRIAHRLVLSKVHEALGMDRAQPYGYLIGAIACTGLKWRYLLSCWSDHHTDN
jgi:long-subunit acyl-CoA synthetase (AMP-forming)